jgi:hypothetical protein
MTSLLTQRQPPEARETGGIARGIATLDEGRLYALQHPSTGGQLLWTPLLGRAACEIGTNLQHPDFSCCARNESDIAGGFISSSH